MAWDQLSEHIIYTGSDDQTVRSWDYTRQVFPAPPTLTLTLTLDLIGARPSRLPQPVPRWRKRNRTRKGTMLPSPNKPRHSSRRLMKRLARNVVLRRAQLRVPLQVGQRRSPPERKE